MKIDPVMNDRVQRPFWLNRFVTRYPVVAVLGLLALGLWLTH